MNLKNLLIIIFLIFSNEGKTQDIKKAYFAGGCFWCMEEAFEKIEGVIDVFSGYSGGTTKNRGAHHEKTNRFKSESRRGGQKSLRGADG